jgi:[FeFe] hydrogenase H-cluster maturation GTPase HydF
MNNTPSAGRVQIAFFGKRNAGKSSVINAVTGQELAIVSDVRGTTTDPVRKTMELLPIGPCVLVDTAGLDDDTPLGGLRTQKTLDVLSKTDMAVFVTDGGDVLDETEAEILETIKRKKIPVIAALNKSDVNPANAEAFARRYGVRACRVSARTGEGIETLKNAIAECATPDDGNFQLLRGLVAENDVVLLVTPIDASAPKGRLILPQQQTVRDALERDAVCIVAKETHIKHALSRLKQPPNLAVTDSQAFARVAADLPADVPLTSFSILFARLKGGFDTLLQGAEAVTRLRDGDRILIAEACTHHAQAEDIGRVKIPAWLREKTGKQLIFEHSAGGGYSGDLTRFALVVHCGGCMLRRRELLLRVDAARQAGVPIVNYGILIAYLHGILDRAIAPITEKEGINDH